MKASITRIGNSKGIIIPAHILKQCGFENEISLEIKDDALVISKAEQPRSGWEEAFIEAGEENVPIDGFSNDFDQDEWTW